MDYSNIRNPRDVVNVPDICIIYISNFDVFGHNLVAYHIDRCIRETSEIVFNGMTEIYVYAKARDGSDLSKLMEVFTEPDKYDFERFPATSMRKQQFKETEKGKQTMCNIVEQYAQSVAQNAVKEMLQSLGEERVQEKISDLQNQLAEAQEQHYKSFFALVSEGEISPETGAKHLGMRLDDFLAKMTEAGYILPSGSK